MALKDTIIRLSNPLNILII